MGELLVRRATTGDAAAVRDVIERAIRGSAASLYSPTQIEAWASGGSRHGVHRMIEETVSFVAEADGAVVGFTNLDGGDVDQLYVDPEVGGRGVARAPYGAVEEEARRRRIRTPTATASLRAVPAFVRFGFAALERSERPFNGEQPGNGIVEVGAAAPATSAEPRRARCTVAVASPLGDAS